MRPQCFLLRYLRKTYWQMEKQRFLENRHSSLEGLGLITASVQIHLKAYQPGLVHFFAGGGKGQLGL